MPAKAKGTAPRPGPLGGGGYKGGVRAPLRAGTRPFSDIKALRATRPTGPEPGRRTGLLNDINDLRVTDPNRAA